MALPQIQRRDTGSLAGDIADITAVRNLRTQQQNEPVEAEKRKTALAENSLKQQQTAMQQRLLTALEKQLPPGATQFDLQMAYRHYELTGGIPTTSEGLIDLPLIQQLAKQANDIKMKAAEQASAQTGVNWEDGIIPGAIPGTWSKAKIPYGTNPDRTTWRGQPIDLGPATVEEYNRALIEGRVQGGATQTEMGITGLEGTGLELAPGLVRGAGTSGSTAGSLGRPLIPGALGGGGGTTTGPKSTEAQDKAALAAAAMWMEELNVLNQLQSGYDPTTYDLSSWKGVKDTTQNLLDRAIYRKGEGFIKDIATGSIQSDASKTYLPAMGNWVRQLMRYQSGAQIKPEEINSALTDYFPLPGDTAEAVEQKRMRRKTAHDVMAKISGPQNEIFLHHLTSNLRATNPELFAAPATKTPLPANSPLRKAPSPAPVDPRTGKLMVAPKAASTVPVTPVDDSAARLQQQPPSLLDSPLKLFGRAGQEIGGLLQASGTTPSQVLNEVPGSLSLPLPSGVVNPITGAGALGTLGGNFLQTLINNNAMDFRSRHPDMTPPGVPATRTKRIILEDTTPTPPITPFGGFGRFLPY